MLVVQRLRSSYLLTLQGDLLHFKAEILNAFLERALTVAESQGIYQVSAVVYAHFRKYTEASEEKTMNALHCLLTEQQPYN